MKEEINEDMKILKNNQSEINNSFFQVNITSESLIKIYLLFYPTTKQYTWFSEAQKTFSKINHILGHKVSINSRKLK
jgi:chlorite dismutase